MTLWQPWMTSIPFSLREDRQVYMNLQEECKKTESEIAALRLQCETEMEKRFGQGVSFADVEAFAGVNRTLEEMRESAKKLEEKDYLLLQAKEVLMNECVSFDTN